MLRKTEREGERDTERERDRDATSRIRVNDKAHEARLSKEYIKLGLVSRMGSEDNVHGEGRGEAGVPR